MSRSHVDQQANIERQLAGETAEPANKDAALEVIDLNYTYQNQRDPRAVIDGIDFEIREGEFVAVMGPSGCGKSTLLNLVAGFESPTGGRIRCAGRDVARPGADRGVVFQKPALYPWMNVLENVLFGPKATRRGGPAAEKTARSVLAEVGLAGYESYKPYELSGGMQHRVAIARTLVNEPRLLLMDEPFAALDAQTRSDMQTLVLEMRERHRSTVMFVTHDIEEGLLLADRVVVLTQRPAVIAEIVTVDIARPRTYDVVMTQQFIELRRHIRRLIVQSTSQQSPPLH